MINTKNITRVFKNGHETIDALKNVDMNIKKGEFIIIMGKSGSGKTTLLNLLGALDRPTSGEIFIDSQNITNFNDKKRDILRQKKIGFVFQSVALLSMLTAYENVDFGLRIAGWNRAKRDLRVNECLDIVGLKKRMNHKPGQLSGGEQQRVAIARAIAIEPEIVLADEPTGELDTNTGLKVVKLFRELVEKENITLVMTTHDREMAGLADRVYEFEDGMIK